MQAEERFHREFLPRYGKLWRKMVEQRFAKPSRQPTNFFDAIQKKTSTTLQLHRHDDLDCRECTLPIFEIDIGSDENEPIHHHDHFPYSDDASSSLESDRDDEFPSGNTASTPLLIDVQDNIRPSLAFGEGDEVFSTRKLSFDVSPNMGKTVDYMHSGQVMTANDSPRGMQSKGYQNEKSGNETDSSSGSTMRFDISHVLVTTPTTQGMEKDIFTETLVPQFSPTELISSKKDCIENLSFSDTSLVQVDLSSLLKSPERITFVEQFQDSDDITNNGDTNKEQTAVDGKSHGSTIREDKVFAIVDGSRATSQQNESAFVGLVEEKHIFSAVNRKHEARGNEEELIGTSNKAVEHRWSPSRTSQKTIIEVDDSSEGTLRKGEKSSDTSLQSPEEVSYMQMDDRRKVNIILSRGPKLSTLVDDESSWNPNKASSTKNNENRNSSAAFKNNRQELSARYFQEYQSVAFQGKLQSVQVVWSNKLRTTAGLTRLQKRQVDFTPGFASTRCATIELSTKILDNPERLRATLLHEMVHAAAWVIDGVSKPPHGPCFKKWANIAMKLIPGVEVTTTHDYHIQYKYAWACTTPSCKFFIQRHSRSVDIQRQFCPKCRGQLLEVDAGNHTSTSDGQKMPKKRAPPSEYNLFFKEHSKAVRERLLKQGPCNVSQVEVVKECARLWQVHKQQERGKINEQEE